MRVARANNLKDVSVELPKRRLTGRAVFDDESKSLSEGAITVPGSKAGGWNYRLYAASGFFDANKPIRKFTKQELHDLLHHEPARTKIRAST